MFHAGHVHARVNAANEDRWHCMNDEYRTLLDRRNSGVKEA